jgi:hypothetical protein
MIADNKHPCLTLDTVVKGSVVKHAVIESVASLMMLTNFPGFQVKDLQILLQGIESDPEINKKHVQTSFPLTVR